MGFSPAAAGLPFSLAASAALIVGFGASWACAQEPVPAGTQADAEADAEAGAHAGRVAAMLENTVLLEAMTLQLARELAQEGTLPGVEGHVLEVLREGEGAPRIIQAVRLCPGKVEGLVASGAWRPQDLKEWKWLVITALHEELFSAMPQSLRLSMDLEGSPTRWIAGGLLFTPDDPMHGVVVEGFEHGDSRNRAYTAFAISANGHEDYIGAARQMMRDKDVWARSNALASLVRLDDVQGVSKAQELFYLPAQRRRSQDISYLFEALERAAPHPNVLKFVRSLQGDLIGVERAAVDSILVLHGGLEDTGRVRAEILGIDPMAPELHRAVRALAKVGAPEDIDALATLFRRQNSSTVALELVTALARAGRPEALPFLRAAALELPWNQALLAAASARASYAGGDEVLLGWIRGVTGPSAPERVRLLGWALGKWGDHGTARRLREAGVPRAAAIGHRLGQLGLPSPSASPGAESDQGAGQGR